MSWPVLAKLPVFLERAGPAVWESGASVVSARDPWVGTLRLQQAAAAGFLASWPLLFLPLDADFDGCCHLLSPLGSVARCV